MELIDRLRILADAAKYDASCASSGSKRERMEGGVGNATGHGICHAFTPDGRCVSLLKVLLTNACVFDCSYCCNRVGSNIQRARMTPGEVVFLTLSFYRRNAIDGLFLSSGIVRDADHTMEQIVEVGRLLRDEHRFGGYIHFKVVPGASTELIARAGQYADRLSANVELATQADLDRLAPAKTMQETEGTMRDIATRIEGARESDKIARFAPAGQSTQIVVGATPTVDGTILRTADRLYRAQRLRRVYYTAYSPTQHSAGGLPSAKPALMREHRLYQADWLLRNYGFTIDELVGPAANLRLDVDPKLAWAITHREQFPVDVNVAPREALLRVPGLGVRNVDRILSLRRHRRLRLDDLVRLKVIVPRAKMFLTTADATPKLLERSDLIERVRPAEQLSLFDAARSARDGEL